METQYTLKGLDSGVAHDLLSKAVEGKLGKELIYTSKGKRGIASIYLNLPDYPDHVVRISNHWSDSDLNPNIYQGFKCGLIGRSRVYWSLKGTNTKPFKFEGKYFMGGLIPRDHYYSLAH